jgi:acyl carrier protein
MSSVFSVSIDDIDDTTSPDTLESWDSVNHMNLIIALEEEFLVKLSDEDIIEMINYKLIFHKLSRL